MAERHGSRSTVDGGGGGNRDGSGSDAAPSGNPKLRIHLNLRATATPPGSKKRKTDPTTSSTSTCTPVSFEVTSGALCYGSLDNVRCGSARPIQKPADACGEPEFGAGTVLVNPSLAYNVAALNGMWRVHRLVNVKEGKDGGPGELKGFFCCHESVEGAEGACRRILQVAGSCNEGDDAEPGPNRNTEATREAGVIVINRYDWEGDNPDAASGAWVHGCITLCDYGSAGRGREKEWEAAGRGVALNLPCAEYRYGRVGFDTENQLAHSFLYFGGETRFVETRMEGRQDPLVRKTTPEERYRKELASGERFDGFDSVLYNPVINPETGQIERAPRPPARLSGQLVGPFSTEEHRIFLDDDLDAVRRASPASDCPFEPSLMTEYIGPLLDELLMSYIASTFLPALPSMQGAGGLESLFLTSDGTLKPMYEPSRRALVEDPGSPPDGLDRAAVSGRLEKFAASQGHPWTTLDSSCPSSVQVCVMLEYVLTEILEVTVNAVRDRKWPCIVPLAIRSAVFYDQELSEMLERSSAFWLPTG